MTDVFISYSRKDIAFARLLHQALIENDLETWIDWQDIPPSTDWLAEVYEAIEGADAFVFVISETSLASEVCSLEIAHAAKHNKRLIPIVIKDVDAEQVPRELSVLNWIFFDDAGEKFAEAMEDLVTAITIDQDWVKGHTRFENRALDWERKDRDRGLLLRGADLSEAETWLAGSAEKDPQPTALQTQFILKSREDATRRQRMTLMGVGAALVVAVGLGILAWTQRNVAVLEGQARATQQAIAEAASTQAVAQKNEAERQALLAKSGQYSVEALSHLEDQFSLALLLSVEAVNTADTLQARSSLLTAVSSHPHLVNTYYDFPQSATSVTYSPDGSMLVAAGCADPGPSAMTLTCEGTELVFYEVSSGKMIERVLTEHEVFIAGLDFSPDGTLLATSDWQGKITLWDMSTRTQIGGILVGPGGRVLDVLFAPDGETLIASYEVLNSGISPIGGEVWYWNTQTHQVSERIPRPTTLPYSGMVLSGDGDRVITITMGSSNIALRDLATMEPISDQFGNNGIAPRSLALSPNGKTLALGNHDGSLTFWDAVKGVQLPIEVDAHDDSIADLTYSPDGAYLVTVSEDQTIRVWDAEIYEEVSDPFAYTDRAIADIAFLPNSHQFAAASSDGSVTVWSLDEVTSVARVLTGHSDEIWDVAFTSTGKFAGSASADGTIRVWDLAVDLLSERELTASSGQLYTLAFSPDDALLAVGGQLGLEIWDWKQGERLHVNRTAHTEPIVSLEFSPDGELLATGGMDAQILLWDPELGTTIGDPLLGHQSVVTDLAFTPDSRNLLSVGCSYATTSVCEEGQILLWTLDGTPTLSVQFEAHDRNIYDIEVSPDGSQFATASADENVLLWEMGNGERLRDPILGHEFGVVSLAYSPDGDLLASGGIDHTLMLTDLETRQRIGPMLDAHQGVVKTLDFSPDGNWLISGSEDRSLLLWPMLTEDWIEIACERSGRNLTADEWQQYFPDRSYEPTCPQYP